MGQLPTLVKLFPLNTQAILIEGLQDVTTGQYLDAATASATLVDQRGKVDPILNGINLVYQGGTNGNYLGTVPATFNAKLGDGYTLQVSAVQGGVQSFFSIPAKVMLRSEQ